MGKDKAVTHHLEFENNSQLSVLVGPHDRHLCRMERRLGLTLAVRGNHIAITGPEPEASYAKAALQYLYSQLSKGFTVDIDEVEAAIRLASATVVSMDTDTDTPLKADISIATKRRMVFPRSKRQADYIQSIQNNDLVFGVGPAGTGKTYLAVAVGVSLLLSGRVDRIILSRPAVEAGEHLGFLPGDLREKVDPYLRPLYDALQDMLPTDQFQRRLLDGEIEVAPLAFMRGRTLSNAFVILDEAQNTTSTQMKMLLTRLGNNSRMVINGDLTQIDLPSGTTSGLKEALEVLQGIEGMDCIYFQEEDIVRHPLVSKIVHAYERHLLSTKKSSPK